MVSILSRIKLGQVNGRTLGGRLKNCKWGKMNRAKTKCEHSGRQERSLIRLCEHGLLSLLILISGLAASLESNPTAKWWQHRLWINGRSLSRNMPLWKCLQALKKKSGEKRELSCVKTAARSAEVRWERRNLAEVTNILAAAPQQSC